MTPQPHPAPAFAEPSGLLIASIAFATGALVANLYYAQPLVDAIGRDIAMSPRLAGFITSVTQIGYGLGLFFLVSLADVVENRRLVLITLALTVVGLLVAALSPSAAPFLASCLVIGLCSTGAQVLVPFVSQLVPPERRGRTVGNVMSGLLAGIMLARPLALFVTEAFGWRAVFLVSAALMVGVFALIAAQMPRHQPAHRLPYAEILRSMRVLWRDLPALRWRSLFQCVLFATFNLYWTAAPLMLADRFDLSEGEIGLFALAGAGGALAAPFAGRLADRGRSNHATLAAILAAGATFLLTLPVVLSFTGLSALVALAALAILFDAAAQGNQVVTQRILFTAATPENRGRVNAVYMTIVFFGGALGSFLATVLYHAGGWPAVAALGTLAPLVVLALFLLQRRLHPNL